MSSCATSVMIADDHPLVLEGLLRLLATAPEFQVTGSFSDGETVLMAIKATPPDIAVLDFNMPGANGLDVIAVLSRDYIPTKVVFFGAMASDREIFAALSMGAQAVLFKDSAQSTLIDCLRAVDQGQRWLPAKIEEAVEREQARHVKGEQLRGTLTPREREIVLLAGAGLTNTNIATKLGLSLATVKVHMHRIYPKISTFSRREVAAIGREFDDIL
jgi:two-component system, NarL family, nitrate/nitrite response regulator NarL